MCNNDLYFFYIFVRLELTLGLKLTILLSLTMRQGLPALKPKLVSSRPEQSPSQDLLKRQAFLTPVSLSKSPRSMYFPGASKHATQQDMNTKVISIKHQPHVIFLHVYTPLLKIWCVCENYAFQLKVQQRFHISLLIPSCLWYTQINFDLFTSLLTNPLLYWLCTIQSSYSYATPYT